MYRRDVLSSSLGSLDAFSATQCQSRGKERSCAPDSNCPFTGFVPLLLNIKMQLKGNLCKDSANGYKQQHAALWASWGCWVSNILLPRPDIHSSFSLPRRSPHKTRPSTVHPHPAQAAHLLGCKTNNVLQLWLAFLLCLVWASLLPSHAEQLAPSGLTHFLRTFWGLHQFSTNTALCLCPEVSRSASCWGWGARAIGLLHTRKERQSETS